MDGHYGGSAVMPAAKVTIPDVIAMKRAGKRITMMTAYDVAFARLVDASGIDIILVGDSLGMVMLGYPTTVPVTMDDMVRHAAAVSRGASRALLVGDMPFGSYQAGPADAMRSAARFLKEAGMDAVKVEGGRETVDTVRALVENGISVMAHVGLTPQRVAQFGGFKVQAKSARAARRLIDDCLALEDAGAFSIVLESVPSPVAAMATERVSIPTIGIGAGPGCDGQVLVLPDLLGLFGAFTPKFAKRY
ncbi:MAG: 3-methyl-2-oxobutanoate hydroxymethyltransferase, partial [Chloroflexota bacterium]